MVTITIRAWIRFAGFYCIPVSLIDKDEVNLVFGLCIRTCPGVQSTFMLFELGVCYDEFCSFTPFYHRVSSVISSAKAIGANRCIVPLFSNFSVKISHNNFHF